jgi:rubrerythrin
MPIQLDEQTWCKLLDAIVCAMSAHPEVFTEAQKRFVEEQFERCQKVQCPQCVEGWLAKDGEPPLRCGFCQGEAKVWTLRAVAVVCGLLEVTS